MQIRDWDDILQDVVESDADPAGWRAIGGDRKGGIGEDLYLAHQEVGAYQIKTYAKNPFQVEGVGARVARSIGSDIAPLFPDKKHNGIFGVQALPQDGERAKEQATELEAVLEAHADAPTTPQALIEDMLEALDSPAYGPMEFDRHGRPAPMSELTNTFEEAESLLTREFEDIVDETVSRGIQ
jgi:hypothetical protein